MLLNLFSKPPNVLPRPIPQRLFKVPPRPLPQLLAVAVALPAAAATALGERALTFPHDRLVDVAHALPYERARGLGAQPGREDVPPGSARGHLEAEVARAVDELEHRVRRVVALAVAELVYARVAARALCVARCERLE
jgi:hypothetical protein